MSPYSTIVFDLDGTLLDTLDDLWLSVNHALRAHNLPERTRSEVRSFLGNGVAFLLRQSVPAGTDDAQLQEVLATFRGHYVEHSQDNTHPYDGIGETLTALKARGKRMAIVSNKPDEAVQLLHRRFFSKWVDVAIGESAGMERKPAPAMVFAAMARLGAEPGEAVYVGDSEVDMLTARNAALPCVSVLWGFRDADFLEAQGAHTLISEPAELVRLLG